MEGCSMYCSSYTYKRHVILVEAAVYSLYVVFCQCRYAGVHFVDVSALRSHSWPVEPAQFEALILQHCQQTRELLHSQ